MTTKRNEDPAAVAVQVYTGPGVAIDALAYATDRFGVLQQYAYRPITGITVRVTRPRDTATPGLVRVGANLSVGDRLLRAQGTGPNLVRAVDEAFERLRRQLTDLPHGRRGDHVPHHRAAH